MTPEPGLIRTCWPGAICAPVGEVWLLAPAIIVAPGAPIIAAPGDTKIGWPVGERANCCAPVGLCPGFFLILFLSA